MGYLPLWISLFNELWKYFINPFLAVLVGTEYAFAKKGLLENSSSLEKRFFYFSEYPFIDLFIIKTKILVCCMNI